MGINSNQRIYVNLSSVEEADAIKAAAGEAGLSPSAYILARLERLARIESDTLLIEMIERFLLNGHDPF